MMLPLRIAVALALGGQLVTGLGTVWAEAQTREIASEKVGAAVTGQPGIAIDSRTMVEFDQCRADIDFALPIKVIQAEVEKCKKAAQDKSKPLEHKDFGDIKQRLAEQQLR